MPGVIRIQIVAPVLEHQPIKKKDRDKPQISVGVGNRVKVSIKHQRQDNQLINYDN